MNAHGYLETLRAIWNRRKWLVVPAFVLPLAAGVTVVMSMPTIYRSAATVIIERQRVPEAFVRPAVTEEITLRLRGISEQALSRERLERMITQFDLYPEFRGLEPMEHTVGRVRQDIGFVPGAPPARHLRVGLVAFAVTFQGRDPVKVANVANEVASFFVDENLKSRERQAAGTAKFLETQLAETKRRLDEHERKLSEFNRTHLGQLPSQLAANIATLEGLDSRLRQNGESQARANDRRSLLALQLSEQTAVVQQAGSSAVLVDPVSGRGPVMVDPASARLADLRRELAIARTRHTDAHPSVIRMKAEMVELERMLTAAPPPPSAEEPTERAAGPVAAAGPTHPQLIRLRQQIAEVELESKTLKAQEGQLNQDIANLRARLENTPRVEQALTELSRDYGSARELYLTLSKRFDEARLAESMEQHQQGEQFRVIDPAVPGTEVAAPKRLLLLAMALVIAAIPAAVLLLAAEKLDTSFHSVDQLRAFTRVPVLSAVPRIVIARDRRRRRWRVALGSVAGATALVLTVWGGYVMAHGNETLVRLMIGGGTP
ncbi:MAG TPA: GNVR domain-containing protein [Candidatus Binatia bacterium]|nr:GNVR domain-containing protein [Candidatus Binatia bacterium]